MRRAPATQHPSSHTPLWHEGGVSIATSTVHYSSSSTELLTPRFTERLVQHLNRTVWLARTCACTRVLECATTVCRAARVAAPRCSGGLTQLGLFTQEDRESAVLRTQWAP